MVALCDAIFYLRYWMLLEHGFAKFVIEKLLQINVTKLMSWSILPHEVTYTCMYNKHRTRQPFAIDVSDKQG